MSLYVRASVHIEYFFLFFDTWCVHWAALAKNTTQRIMFVQKLQEDVKSIMFFVCIVLR